MRGRGRWGRLKVGGVWKEGEREGGKKERGMRMLCFRDGAAENGGREGGRVEKERKIKQ